MCSANLCILYIYYTCGVFVNGGGVDQLDWADEGQTNAIAANVPALWFVFAPHENLRRALGANLYGKKMSAEVLRRVAVPPKQLGSDEVLEAHHRDGIDVGDFGRRVPHEAAVVAAASLARDVL